VILLNLMPSAALGASPYSTPALQQRTIGEHWQEKPNLSKLRAYGCVAYIYDDDVARGDEFQSRAKIGKLVGYEGPTIYRVWLPQSNKVVRSVSVRFDETLFTVPHEALDDSMQSHEDLFGDAESQSAPSGVDARGEGSDRDGG